LAIQIDALKVVQRGELPGGELFEILTKAPECRWSKSYYEAPERELMRAIPPGAKCILSPGSGWGAVEGELVEGGREVVGVPLDAVIGACAAKRGVRLMRGWTTASL